MQIDIHQLPIPDWGLICPKCSYPLRGLPQHRCPECGQTLDMNALVQTWTRLREPRFTGDELPLPDFGMHCGACDAPLAGAAEHACPVCHEPFDPQKLRPAQTFFLVDDRFCAGVPLSSVQAEMLMERLPHKVSRETNVQELYMGSRVSGSSVLVPSEFYFETLWMLQRLSRELQAARRDAGAEWTCASCGEAVPGNFTMCWNCGAECGH